MRAELGELVRQAMAAECTPGAVVLVGRGAEVLLHEAYGARMLAPEYRQMRPDTIFDLASVTKPVATATVFMQLAEAGALDVQDPVSRWLPEYRGGDRDRTTLWHLLTHSSGLPAYRNYPSEWGADVPPAERRARVVSDLCQIPLQYAPGEDFCYSCLGYLLLASVIEAAGGAPLDRLFAERVARPLGLADTGFNPGPKAGARCAATEVLPEGTLCGVVHDENARYLGGVGGNAGLFGTAADLARFMALVLNEGELGGVRLLRPETVREMCRPQLQLPGRVRGLGWDLDTDYSPCLRGDYFPPGSFGHTGYTGTAIWADPASGVYFILLTNRVHYGREVSIQDLRRQVSNVVGRELLG